MNKHNIFIQWKGTDACLDFDCDCGAFCHFDGMFAHYLQCPHCEQIWQMPIDIKATKVDCVPYDSPKAKMMQPDEEIK